MSITIYPLIKAWINFNGTGTIAIRDSFNVLSITDEGTGDYTITWDIDFANVNYTCTAMTGSNNVSLLIAVTGATYAVGSIEIYSVNSVGAAQDNEIINVIAIGDQ